MKFKYSVIGDNTQENREWLEKVGYKPFMWDAYDDAQPFITTMDSGEYTSASKDDRHHYMCSLDINCIGNPPLFKAVSAMREDSDYMQWFVFKSQYSHKSESWFMCTGSNYVQWAKKQYPFLASYVLAHKASFFELQKRFKL